jgi:hypothetical protein
MHVITFVTSVVSATIWRLSSFSRAAAPSLLSTFAFGKNKNERQVTQTLLQLYVLYWYKIN